LSIQRIETKAYWDNVAKEAKDKENVKSNDEWIPSRNWIAEYADAKAKDLLLKTFEKSVALDKNNSQALDIGCGPGKWTRLLAQKGLSVTGIDASAGMIGLAKERTAEYVTGRSPFAQVTFCVMDASVLGFRDASFEFVNCVTVLQHILTDEKWRHAVREIARVTKPQGYLLLYEVAPAFILKRRTQNLRFRTLKEYEAEFAKSGARLVFTLATDISYPLTVLGLRRFSTTFDQNEVYYYWTRRTSIVPFGKILSTISKIVARIARQVDYRLGRTPLGLLSPLRILLFERSNC
jgi:ubiquinone/menaquinone biosynthesis C-methylase UbiE